MKSYFEKYNKHYIGVNSKILADFDSVDMSYLSRYLPMNKNAAIIDLGCGCGLTLGWLSRMRYTNLTGVDISQGQIDYAKEHLPKNIQLDCVEIGAFLGEGFKYDAILIFDVIEHIKKENLPEFIAKIINALRPGGSLIVRVPNAATVLSMACRYGDITHELAFTPESLNQLMNASGMEDGEIIDSDANKPLWQRMIICLRNFGYYLLYRTHEQVVPATFSPMITMRFRDAK